MDFWLILKTAFLIFLIILGILFFIVFVLLRIIRRFYKFPAPSFMTRLIDNPIRRKLIQKPNKVAERMHLKPGMLIIEIGPGKGSYTKALELFEKFGNWFIYQLNFRKVEFNHEN